MRRRGPILIGIFGLLVSWFLFMLLALPVIAQGNPPSVECADDAWNGEYWKIQINDGEAGEIETNVPGAIVYGISDGTFSWTNVHTNDVFRWLFKSGNEETVPWDGLWTQGEGDSAEMPGNLSHVTFCFTDPAPPVTTTTTTTTTEPPPTTTEPPPSTTTTTETPPSTTTTTVTITVPPSSTTSTTTTTTATPSTTTTAVTSTTTPPDTQPPTTTSTEPPENCDENHPTWNEETQTCELPWTDRFEMEQIALAGAFLLVLGALLVLYFREDGRLSSPT